jgi:DNA-directed RNA polymerase specialized sigma24 family protein
MLCTVTVDGTDYAVSRVGDALRVAPVGSEELGEEVALAHLPEEARRAVEESDLDNVALQQAAEGVARAIADRGA